MFRQLRKAMGPSRSPRPRPAANETEIFRFQGEIVEVRRRPHKRSIGVTLQVNGRIKVSAPNSANLAKIESFLEIHAEWIREHLGRYEELRTRYPRKRFCDGESFMFLGESLALRLRAIDSRRPVARRAGPDLVCELPRPILEASPPSTRNEGVSRAIAAFYEREGRRVLAERVGVFAARMSLFPKALSFRSQKTRWGSCSSDGRLSLNWRLIVAPVDVIDYVVVHELAHLRFYNHSRSFWDLVATQCPAYREKRDWLKAHQYEADFLARVSELHSPPSGRPK